MEGSAGSGFTVFRGRIVSATLASIADHWRSASGNKQIPLWSELNPSWIARHLTRVFAFTYDRTSRSVTRAFAGGQLLENLPGNLRGTPVQLLQDPRLAVRMHLTVSRVVLDRTFYRGTGKLFKQGDHIVEGERIVLPMSTDGIVSDGALGASDFDNAAVEDAIEPVEVLHDIEEWYPL